MLLHCVFTCAISKEKNCRSPSLYYSIYNRAFLHPPSGPVVAIKTSSLFLSNCIMICLDMGSFYFLCFEFIEILDPLVYSVDNLGPLLLQIFFLLSQANFWELQLHFYQSSYITCPTDHWCSYLFHLCFILYHWYHMSLY